MKFRREREGGGEGKCAVHINRGVWADYDILETNYTDTDFGRRCKERTIGIIINPRPPTPPFRTVSF